MKLRLLFLLLSLFIVSCASQPKREGVSGPAQSTQWETKAVVKDLKEGKSNTLNIDILADPAGRYRMEVSALMGIQVASLVLNQNEVSYAIYPQKKFFHGPASDTSFWPLMKVPIHPKNFLYLAYDMPLRGSGWKCNLGPDQKLSECQQPSQNVKVQWYDRTEDGQKKVLITGPSFEMRWLFKTPQTEVQFKDETFALVAPAEFKTIQLK